MNDEPQDIRLPVQVCKSMVEGIDAFRAEEGLESRAEAVRLLLEIALDVVSDRGNRFWDKRPDQPDVK